MLSKAKDYRPMLGYEKLYLLNCLGNIKALNRIVNSNGKIISLKQNKPEIKKEGKVIYALIRDVDYKNRKINISKMIINIFGRQKPVVVKEKVKQKINFAKPIYRSGSKGISVEKIHEGKVLEVFESFAAAAKAVGGEYRHISDVCYGKKNFYLGYKWRFKNN